jgi:predicted aspartyl protease
MPPTVEEFIEATRAEPTKKEHINNMVTNMNINGHQALDTGITGTNLMSSSWAQTNNINTQELSTPIIIHMAAKGSKTSANRFAHANVEIKQGTTERTKFLIVAISSSDMILMKPFLQDNHVSLNTAESTTYFPTHNVTIQCATRQLRTLATSAVMDHTWPYRAPATAAIKDSPWCDQVPDDSAKQPIRRTPIIPNPTIMEPPALHMPPCDKMFPTVFSEKEPQGLPPLRHGCNHIIRLDQDKLENFKFHSGRIPDACRTELIAHSNNWKKQGIA